MTDDFDFLGDYWGDDDDGPDSGDWLSEPSPSEKAFIDEILAAYGIESVGEITVNFHDGIDPSELRGDRFATLAEAVMYLYDIGVLGFSDIIYYEDEDLYGARIPADSGPASE